MHVTDRVKLVLVLCAALLQGLIYLVLLPPWQHYDEPTHFEYAWLLANHAGRPVHGAEDRVMRREIAASMRQHNFYANVPAPELLTDLGEIGIGHSELGHPPGYYLLVSLPLRVLRHLDVTSQLYVARVVSLVLFLLTIATVAAVARDLTPSGHVLRWAVPLTALLLPPFADVMTAVNNDVGAVFLVSLFLWIAVRTIRRGLTILRLISLAGLGLLAVYTKNTGAVALLLAPLVVLIALWAQRRWLWRSLVLAAAVLTLLLAAALFGWGDAGYWYRAPETFVQDAATRATDPAAVVGAHALVLDNPLKHPNASLINPVLPHDLRAVAGKTVTFGGWVWADRPATVNGPGLMLGRNGASALEPVTHPISVTTSPRFVAWTSTIPTETTILQYALLGDSTNPADEPLIIRLDGAILVDGSMPRDIAPRFDDTTARTGIWAGQRFTNLLRNGSGEVGWPRLRPWFEHLLVRYAHRSPTQVLGALVDFRRSSALLTRLVAPSVLDGFFTGFAWAHVRLTGAAWSLLFRGIALVAFAGCIKWLLWHRGHPSAGRPPMPVLVFLGLAGVLVWANTVMRPLPLLEARIVIPAARYAFPAIVPTVLVLAGGWWALWPRGYRSYGVLALVLCLAALNIVSIWYIDHFYRSLPTA